MAWFLVRPLADLRTQLNELFPNRDKTSDGSIGDTAHASGRSSHNYDDSPYNNAEWDSDSDTLQEIRGYDADKDLRDPEVTAEQVVQHLLKYCRNGTFWWVRYIIYRGRIWHKNINNYETRSYTGVNWHGEHFHVNSDFTQAADTKSADYRLGELVALTTEDAIKVSRTDGALDIPDWHPSIKDPNQNGKWALATGIHVALDEAHTAMLQSKSNNALLVQILKKVTDDDAEVNQILSEVSRLHELEKARDTEHDQNTANRIADLVARVDNVDEEVMLKLVDPSTPDDDVAEVLVQLLGDRKDAIIAKMQVL